MTAPRQVLPGVSYLVTRRCSERRFFLRPAPTTSEIFLYVLAVVARRYGVLVHAFCVLSDHYHLLVTDPDARLPAFMRDLDSLVARATNASLHRWEGFWSSAGSYSAVAHGATDDLVRKAAYVLSNPVAAGLVPRGRDWPGLRSDVGQLGRARLEVARPKLFFRERGDMPASAVLELAVPPGFSSADEFERRVAAASDEREEEVRRTRKAERRGFLGRARVLAQDPLARAVSEEPHRKLNPSVAAGDVCERVEVLSLLKAFRRAYRSAWKELQSGVREAVFPAGTYLLRIQHGVRCTAAG